jgi:hypothetical protein
MHSKTRIVSGHVGSTETERFLNLLDRFFESGEVDHRPATFLIRKSKSNLVIEINRKTKAEILI